jgi:8-oxo-dGTP diphosphatase
MVSRIHVAVGVLIDSKDCVLLTRRLKGTHLAGYWEFPGGKVEAGESVHTALARELAEELGTRIGETVPLMTVNHDYGEKPVLLDVHQVKDWSG